MYLHLGYINRHTEEMRQFSSYDVRNIVLRRKKFLVNVTFGFATFVLEIVI
jgi:hypothetical protein